SLNIELDRNKASGKTARPERRKPFCHAIPFDSPNEKYDLFGALELRVNLLAFNNSPRPMPSSQISHLFCPLLSAAFGPLLDQLLSRHRVKRYYHPVCFFRDDRLMPDILRDRNPSFFQRRIRIAYQHVRLPTFIVWRRTASLYFHV